MPERLFHCAQAENKTGSDKNLKEKIVFQLQKMDELTLMWC